MEKSKVSVSIGGGVIRDSHHQGEFSSIRVGKYRIDLGNEEATNFGGDQGRLEGLSYGDPGGGEKGGDYGRP